MNKALSKTAFPEKWIFLVLVILNALPVFLYKFFPSMDGAVHTYNAQNMLELLGNPDSRLHEYIIFNPELVPNWGGHIILSFFSLIFPAYIAEKLMFLVYFIGLPYAFRYMITKGFDQQPYLSYLIFPLSYTFLLGLGFYNFSLATALLLFIIGLWERLKSSLSWRSAILFFILITALYFTHMFIYSVLGLVLLTSLAYEFIREFRSLEFKKYLSRIIFLLATFSLSLFLFLKNLFFSGDFSLKGESKYLSTEELLYGITHVRGSIIYSKNLEGTVLLFFFIILLILTLYITIQRYRKQLSPNRKGADSYIISAIIILILYFIIPNSLPGKGGHMSFRFIIAFYLIWVTWISAHRLRQSLALPSIILSLVISGILLSYHTRVIKNLSKSAEQIYDISDHIEPESTILPFNYAGNWLQPHFSAYLGYKKPVIIMENYELNNRVFPLVWNPDMPKVLLGDKDNTQTCTNWKTNNNNTKAENADYVFFWGKQSNDCRKELEQITKNHYQLKAESEHGVLYKRNSK
ncbi:MAG: hypothetical protein ACQESJ_06760 [Bacteroidota bacterium]